MKKNKETYPITSDEYEKKLIKLELKRKYYVRKIGLLERKIITITEKIIHLVDERRDDGR